MNGEKVEMDVPPFEDIEETKSLSASSNEDNISEGMGSSSSDDA